MAATSTGGDPLRKRAKLDIAGAGKKDKIKKGGELPSPWDPCGATGSRQKNTGAAFRGTWLRFPPGGGMAAAPAGGELLRTRARLETQGPEKGYN